MSKNFAISHTPLSFPSYGPMEYNDGYHRPFPHSFACTGEEDYLLACQRRGVGSQGECGTERLGMDEVGIQCSEYMCVNTDDVIILKLPIRFIALKVYGFQISMYVQTLLFARGGRG